MSIFRKRPADEPADPITYAREHVTSPGAHALLNEVGRGWARRAEEAPSDSLHAYEVTPGDAAVIRMMAGAHFGPDATVTLPSGKTITGAEMQRWLEGEPGS